MTLDGPIVTFLTGSRTNLLNWTTKGSAAGTPKDAAWFVLDRSPLVVALAAVLQPYAVAAQQSRCHEMLCRAQGYFRSCDRPLNGAKVFSARVIGLSKECSDYNVWVNIVWLEVDDAKANNLPIVVEIDLGAW